METKMAYIDAPDDVKKMTLTQLKMLCRELRSELLTQVSQTGGHLASNLGVVELTVALHYVLDCPKDKILWDVGHQSYIHKMLTGRRERMNELRKFGGLSGFTKRSESAYDAFGAGHSSTALSAALGMAIARDLKKETYRVVAVVGDGALTGGMSLEGLNHAGHEKRNLLLVLNDNAMSISPNEGALSSYLNRLRSNPAYWQTKGRVSECLHGIPLVGPVVETCIRSLKNFIRSAVLKHSTVFEELGWTYIGPIDGHDVEKLIAVLKNSIQLPGPVLLHVITKKGKGYPPAEKNPDTFHGVGAFDLKTGKMAPATGKTYTQIFTDFILEQGKTNPNVAAITAAMAGGTGLEPFSRAYPTRFFDVGICEQHAVTLAAGMACEGLHPVVCIYSTFLQRAVDQIIHDAALQNLPILFAVDRAGLVGEDGATHQGVFDLSLLRAIPNVKIYTPSNGQELYAALRQGIQANGPVIVRYPRGTADLPLPDGSNLPIEEEMPLEKAVCKQTGRDIALLAMGRGCRIADKVCVLLQEKGLQPTLLHFRSVKPLDEEAVLQAAAACSRLVTIEDAAVVGGFGSAVLETVSDAGRQAEVLCVGIPDRFVEQGKVEQLWEDLQMQPEQIVERIRKRWPEWMPKD